MDNTICPGCNHTLRMLGKTEWIVLDPADPTKAVIKSEHKQICENPLCSLFAGDPENPTKPKEHIYQKNGKAVLEIEQVPNVDHNNIRKYARIAAMPDKIVDVK